MDIVFLLGIALLWGVTSMLVAGFVRLDQPAKGRA